MVRIFLIFSLLSFSSFSNEQDTTEEVNITKKQLVVDMTHQLISQGLFRLTNSIDQFFGNKKTLDERNGTRFRVFNVTVKNEGEKIQNNTEMRIRLKLPNLENRLRIVIEKKAEEVDTQTPTPESQSITNVDQPSDDVRVGAEFIGEKLKNWDLRLTTGFEVKIPPGFDPYARFRARYQKTLFTNWQMRFIMEPFWFRANGFGETTILDFDYPLTDDHLLFRFGNDFTWTDETDFFRFSHGPALFHRLSDRRAMAYSFKMNGKTKPINQVESYDASISYRQLLYKNWFFYELVPFGGFAKERDWKFRPGISFKLELIIGDI